jgi:hypothetical protein
VSLCSFSWRFWHALSFCVCSPFSREGEWFVIQSIGMLIHNGNETSASQAKPWIANWTF